MPDASPLAHAEPPLTGLDWWRAYTNMVFVDHGFIRAVYLNLHRESPNMWRAAQPGPSHLRRAKAMGIRTVLNLRGWSRSNGSYKIERDTCARLGLEMVDFQVRSRALPEKEVLREMRPLFDRLAYPVLMHCKSGADRAGLMSALYLHLHEGVPIDIAKRQLSLRYGHVRYAKTGILDFFLERYRQETGGDSGRFEHWVDTVYDPDALAKEFHAGRFATFVVDRILGRE